MRAIRHRRDQVRCCRCPLNSVWHQVRYLVFALGIGALFVAGSFGVRSGLGAESVDETQAEVASLRAEVHALRADHARVLARPTISVAPAIASSTAPSSANPSSPDPVDDGAGQLPSFEEQLRRSQERASELDEILFQGRRDPEWDAETESAFTRMLAEKLRSSVRPVDILCRHTMCRIKLEHPGGGGPLDAIDTIQGEPLMAGEFYVMLEPPTADGGGAMTTVYVARSGWPLPPTN